MSTTTNLGPHPDLATFDSADGNFKLMIRTEPPSDQTGPKESPETQPLRYRLFLLPTNRDGESKFTEADQRSRLKDGSICVGETEGNNSLQVRQEVSDTLDAINDLFAVEFPVQQINAVLNRHAKHVARQGPSYAKANLDLYPELAAFNTTDGDFKLIIRTHMGRSDTGTDSRECHLFLKPLNQRGEDRLTDEEEPFRFKDGSICLGSISANSAHVRQEVSENLSDATELFETEFSLPQIQSVIAKHLSSTRRL